MLQFDSKTIFKIFFVSKGDMSRTKQLTAFPVYRFANQNDSRHI